MTYSQYLVSQGYLPGEIGPTDARHAELYAGWQRANNAAPDVHSQVTYAEGFNMVYGDTAGPALSRAVMTVGESTSAAVGHVGRGLGEGFSSIGSAVGSAASAVGNTLGIGFDIAKIMLVTALVVGSLLAYRRVQELRG